VNTGSVPPPVSTSISQPSSGFSFVKATRNRSKLRLGLIGVAGAGKTMSALKLALGIGAKIAVIDTENGSACLYSNLGDYDVCSISEPYTPQKYIDAIKAAENAGYDTIIIDSLSAAWSGAGGMLDQQNNEAKKTGNGYTAWRTVSPLYNRLVDTLLQSKSHIIVTLRAKQEYVIDKDVSGKTSVRKVGLGAVARDGMEYEFDVVIDIDARHEATASKDRTSLFADRTFIPSEDIGRELKTWLNS